MTIAFLFKNLWDYEEIHGVPVGLPDGIKTFYLTDSESNKDLIREKGWDYVFITDKFKNISDSFKRRRSIGFINCYPEKLVPELNDYDKVFVCDSNIIKLPDNYFDFLSKSTDEYALYLSSGYYKGSRDNIVAELKASDRPCWRYNLENMKSSVSDYIKVLNSRGLSYTDYSIVIAKYIGWNLKHEKKEILREYAYEEHLKHLQGNIIFTMVSILFEEFVFNYKKGLNSGRILSKHRASR